jgi:ubiquinone/menaquinone biosynthesis C-methylase UbiE
MAHRGSNRERNVWAVGLLDVQPDDRVLEVGFGPGIAIRELARRATRGLVVGVDHSEVMLRQAQKRNAAAVRAGRVDLRLGSAESLPVFDAPFDKILAVNSLMFWDDPVARLRELGGRLRPGGKIAIAFQPRGPGASDETAARAGREIAEHFAAARFTEVRVQTRDLRPTPVVCVAGLSQGA